MDVARRSTGRAECRLFDGGNLGEVVERVKRYVAALPNGKNFSMRGIIKITNTYSLDATVLLSLLEHPSKAEPMPAQTLPLGDTPQGTNFLRNGKAMLNPEEAAEMLGVKKQTLAKWRISGDSPPFFKIRGLCRYRREDLEKWIEEKKRENTSQY